MVQRVITRGESVVASLFREASTTVTILEEVGRATRDTPIVFGVFLFVGGIGSVLPSVFSNFLFFVASCATILVLYRALGGEISVDSSLTRRIVVAVVTISITVPILVGGFVLLFLPGVYLYFRLFLALPAVLVDSYGPFEALSRSWAITDGSVLAALGTYVIVFIAMVLVFLPVLALTGSRLLVDVGATTLAGPFAAGVQAYLYFELADTE